MKLKRMCATFGALQKEELHLAEGLNIITAPNESGKSTWASFLLAMLYGVDSSERSSKGVLPVKTKYKPWSGQAMEGSLTLEFEGREITVERTSRARVQLGELRVYDTNSGQDISIREDSCGQMLVGVERSVYERSGFIHQQRIIITGDHTLEARLNALVTTGDESISYTQVEKKLRALKNRRRAPAKTGLLPEAEHELDEIEARLEQISRLGLDAMSLQARADALAKEEEELVRIDAALKARDTLQKRQQLAEARADWEKKERFLAEKQETVANLPPLPPLLELLHALDVHIETAQTLESELQYGVSLPEAPHCPTVFAEMDADEVRRRADLDADILTDAAARAPKKSRLWMLALLLALGGAAACFFLPPLGIGILAAAVLLGAVHLIITAARKKRAGDSGATAQQILTQYGAADAQDLRRIAAEYREALLLFEQKNSAAKQQQDALNARAAAHAARNAELMTQVLAFAPDADSLAAARAATQKAIHLRQFFETSLRNAVQAKEKYTAIFAALGDLPATDAAALPLEGDYDAQQVSRQLIAVRQELQSVRSQLDLGRGRRDAAGDPVVLNAKKEQLVERIKQLEAEYQALDAALDALKRANDALQTRFSPQINELASAYMARMTNGRYERVFLGQGMQIDARQTGEITTRSSLALSTGTAEQLYLAARLAIAQLTLPPDAPLVLDDALVYFDDERMASALDLLRELAKTRQVLLFTCQNREQRWLDAQRN